MGTVLSIAALAAAAAGGYANYKTTEAANKQLEKQMKKENSKPPEAVTEQDKIDAVAKKRGTLQAHIIAGAAGKGSTATGGTTLG